MSVVNTKYLFEKRLKRSKQPKTKIMEEITQKMDLPATCPYCCHEDTHIFYIGATHLFCNNPECEKEFMITVYANDINIVATKTN